MNQASTEIFTYRFTLSLAPLNLQTGALRSGKPVAIRFATHLQQNIPLLDATLEGTTTAQLAENQQDFSLNGLVAHVDLNSQARGKLPADVKSTLRGETAAQQYFMPDLQAQVQLPQGKVQLNGRLQANLAQESLSIAGLRLQAGLKQGQQLNGMLLSDPLTALAMESKFKADTPNYPPFQLQKATLGVQMANGVLTLGTGSNATDPNAPSMEEQLKQKVEEELKQKLKGLL